MVSSEIEMNLSSSLRSLPNTRREDSKERMNLNNKRKNSAHQEQLQPLSIKWEFTYSDTQTYHRFQTVASFLLEEKDFCQNTQRGSLNLDVRF